MQRRQFLRGVGLGSVAAALPAYAASWLGRPGLQLFTVMKLLDADLDGTLKAVAKIGYRNVETVGSFSLSAAELRDALARHGLSSPSQHLMPGTLYADFSAFNRGALSGSGLRRSWAQAFDFQNVEAFISDAITKAKVLQQKYIVWPLSWPRSGGVAEAKAFAAAFNVAGRLCKQAGVGFAVHNHNQEFALVDGMRAYDVMLQETDPETVKFEMDFMWASVGGVDPVAYFERFPGRFRLVHLKDRTAEGRVAIPGKGIENFPRLLDASVRAGIEYAFVEYDQPQDPMADIRAAYAYFANLHR